MVPRSFSPYSRQSVLSSDSIDADSIVGPVMEYCSTQQDQRCTPHRTEGPPQFHVTCPLLETLDSNRDASLPFLFLIMPKN